jgi:hypothetical protein
MSGHRKNAQLVTLIDALQKKLIDPSALSSRLRTKVVQYYMEEHSEVSCRRVAEIAGCSHTHVVRLRRKLAEIAALELDTIDIKRVAGQFKMRKEELQRRAMSDRDWGTAWKIECDYIEKLQSFGFIILAPHRVLNINIDLESRLKEFFNEFGVPTTGEFLAKLRELQGDNGRGPRGLLVVANQPSGPASSSRDATDEEIED